MRSPVTARSTGWVCESRLPKTAGSNPANVLDVRLWWVLCVVTWRSLGRADLSSKEVLPCVCVCVCVCVPLSVIQGNNNLYTYNK